MSATEQQLADLDLATKRLIIGTTALVERLRRTADEAAEFAGLLAAIRNNQPEQGEHPK